MILMCYGVLCACVCYHEIFVNTLYYYFIDTAWSWTFHNLDDFG